MRYGSICSGIEAASVAWHSLRWSPQWFAEIAPFPSAVLAHHLPAVPNRGDFTRIDDAAGSIDLLVGGTPCQDFSVAGLRAGLAGERGNLTLEFVRLARRARPRWILWENVPGVLSIDGGRAFGAFLGGLGECGYGFAYRVLDAQYFGVPQRRRRVFVVGHLGDWRRAAAVLFESASLRWNPPPRREEGARVAGGATGFAASRGRSGDDGAAAFASNGIASYGEGVGTLRADGGADCGGGSETLIAHTLRGAGKDASEDGSGRGTPLVCAVQEDNQNGVREYETTGSLRADAPGTQPCGSLLRIASGVRRLTPRECERLQEFPDDWTAIPYRGKSAADGPRYEAIGNSMAVPVMRWIGERIAMVDALDLGVSP